MSSYVLRLRLFGLAVLPYFFSPHPARGQVGENWCTHSTAQRLDGYIDDDQLQDALCHDRETGHKWVALKRSGTLEEVWIDDTIRWCRHDGAELHLGDVNGDRRADLVCKDRERIWIDYYQDNAFYTGTDYHFDTNWCTHQDTFVFIGDQNGDGRADLVCRGSDGHFWVLFADAAGRLADNQTGRQSPDFRVTRIRRVPSGYVVHIRNDGWDGVVTEVACRVGSTTQTVVSSLHVTAGSEGQETVRLPLVGTVRCSVAGKGLDDQPELFISNNSFSAPAAGTF